ncbi:uncharacterized protein LOC105704427 [Orussus abietinus]|uniref:uncharacterized protein LOC105704427 n=1 Tax=Orussus abietinus TaxID=222816 RepID=UPI000625DF8B|nr:uncharacterized protein LOC105704427 [Orussus abietinus]
MASNLPFNPKQEQLYMLEFLLDCLNVKPEREHEIGSTSLSVHFEFADFARFEVKQEEFVFLTRQVEKTPTLPIDHKTKNGLIQFGAGKSCLFTKQPADLIRALKSQPLKISVHHVSNKQSCTKNEEPTICETLVPLSGCLCDQVAMSMNDANHLPRPYALKNTYNLVDPQGDPFGTISISLRLSCFGKFIMTQFAFQEKSFLFKTLRSANEFQCTRVLPDEDEFKKLELARNNICRPDSPIFQEPEIDPLPKPRSVIALSTVCQELARRDSESVEMVSLIRVSSEKKSDDAGPQESEEKISPDLHLTSDTCIYSPEGMHFRPLRSAPCGGAVCPGGICAGKKLLEIVPPDHLNNAAGKSCNSESLSIRNSQTMANFTTICCYSARMRGGGCCDNNEPDHLPIGETRNKSKTTERESRLMGSNEISNQSRIIQSLHTLLSGACKPPSKDDKPGCCCFGKTGAGAKKPCMGIDCLIKSFKETQKFVEGIGKVPGMAGLGLMDPSESPYFGRAREEGRTTCMEKNVAQQVPPPPLPDNLSSSHPTVHTFQRKVQTPEKVPDTGISNAPQGFGGSPSLFAARPVVSKEVPPTPTANEVTLILAGKVKKKEEKVERQKEHETITAPMTNETGPCGEPKCKSRQKKPVHKVSNETTQSHRLSVIKKPAQLTKPSVPGRGSNIKSEKFRHRANKGKSIPSGPGGDRNVLANSLIKVSKRVMKSVHEMALTNPGIYYGHKNCLDLYMRIPANMGWLWNTGLETHRHSLGWKPGAISRYVYGLLNEAKAGSGASSESRPATPTKGKRGKVLKSKSSHALGRAKKKEGSNEEIEQPPTLHIHRKDGTYYVTMYPVRQNMLDNKDLEPPKPLQFKITKNKDDVSTCSSSTASDMEIEFSPPAAVLHRKKTPEIRDVDTQVKQQEIVDALKQIAAKPGKAAASKPDVAGKKGGGKK